LICFVCSLYAVNVMFNSNNDNPPFSSSFPLFVHSLPVCNTLS
jgi:hypothetical protein